jgi:hypothetical protein
MQQYRQLKQQMAGGCYLLGSCFLFCLLVCCAHSVQDFVASRARAGARTAAVEGFACCVRFSKRCCK